MLRRGRYFDTCGREHAVKKMNAGPTKSRTLPHHRAPLSYNCAHRVDTAITRAVSASRIASHGGHEFLVGGEVCLLDGPAGLNAYHVIVVGSRGGQNSTAGGQN